MRVLTASLRARLGAVLLCAPLLVSGCSWMPSWMPWSHRHRGAVACTETPFTGSDLDEPPLKVPEGLNAPDTRNAIKVPPLNTPDTPRPKSEPCLDQPPSFATAPAVPRGTPSPAAAPAVPSGATPTAPPASPPPPHP